MKPLAIDLYCGLGGWASAFLSEGYDVIGFDNERHVYGEHRYPGQLVLQDVLTIDGARFRDAAVIVASPPCQEPSYRAMPWSRAKALNAAGPPVKFIELFEACFRIQIEASKAAGRRIPMVIENVKGAQPWVGRARWHYGSFYLWGDVPALMPRASHPPKRALDDVRVGVRAARLDGSGVKGARPIGETAPVGTGSTSWFFGTRADPRDMRKNEDGEYTRMGLKNGNDWFGPGENCSEQRRHGSRSNARKQASAMIAKIPFPLAQYLARVFKPE